MYSFCKKQSPNKKKITYEIDKNLSGLIFWKRPKLQILKSET